MKIKGFESITFWLNRVAEEEIKIATELIKEAQTRNWQVLHFKEMPTHIKKEVIEDLKNKMTCSTH